MQISTTTTDFIVDTLELWDCLSCLNEVFCNPNILKVSIFSLLITDLVETVSLQRPYIGF